MSVRSIKFGNVEVTVFPDGTVDEIFVRSDGKCVFHLEKMDENYFWCAAYAWSDDGKMDKELHMDIGSEKPINFLPRSEEPEVMD